MCIVILNTKGELDWNTFENCWANNPDGAGIAYVEDGTLKIIKEMESPEQLFLLYHDIRQENSLPMVIHFRIATSGRVNEDNCHPFEVFPGLAMAHNGIIENVRATKKTSDTRIFIAEILQRLPKSFLFNEGIRQLIEVFVEDSKLVFLDRYGLYNIINEKLGHWDENHTNWYSNYSYTDTYGWTTKLKTTSLFGYEYGQRKKKVQECGCCGNICEESELHFFYELNADLCQDCYSWYREDLVAEYKDQ